MMDQQASVSCAASTDAYIIHESFTKLIYLPGYREKYPLCHVTVQHGTQMKINKMQVLHHVTYVKLYTYI